MAWIKPASLKARREAERDLFLHGTYPGGTVPVWMATDAGRVVWKAVRRLTMPQFLALADADPVFADPGFAAKPAPQGPRLWANLITALVGIWKGRKP